MNIKKTSWHYKLINFFDFSPAHSLCPYVRQLLTSICISLLLVAVGIAMVAVFVWAPLHLVLGLIGVMAISANQITVGLIVWAIYTLAGVIIGGKYMRMKYRLRNPVVEKEPGIVMAYIKAKKEKICPTLNFE